MSERPTRFPLLAVLAALAVLAGLGTVAWKFLGSEPLPSPPDPVLATESAARDSSSVPLEDVRVEREFEQAPDVDRVVGPTAQFRAALGGLRGRVLEADLAPAIGLTVSVLEFQVAGFLLDPKTLLGGAEENLPDFEVARGLTDEEGRFELPGLEARALHLLGIDLDGARATARVVDQSPLPGEWVDLGDIVLEPFVTFVGRVIDPERRPIAGARVRGTNLPLAQMVAQFGVLDLRPGVSILVEEPEFVRGARGSSNEAPTRTLIHPPSLVWKFERILSAISRTPTTVTDDEGNYRLEGVPPGMITVTGDREGYLGAARPPMPSGKQKERKVPDLVLTKGARVGGWVTLGRDRPIEGVQVIAGVVPTAVAGFGVNACLLHPSATTDEKGRFEVLGLPDGPNVFVATRRSSLQPWSIHGPFPLAGGDVKIELTDAESLRVLTVDDGGAPLEHVELYLRAAGPLDAVPGAVRHLLAPPLERLRDVVSEEAGTWRVDGLDPGTYRIAGLADGYALTETEATVVAGEVGRCELVFVPGHDLEVTVDGKDDSPLSYAFVSISPRGIFEDPVDRERTDARGRAVLEGLKAGEYTVFVQHPAHATAQVDVVVPCEPLTIALGEGGHLRGRVHHGDEPPEQTLMIAVSPRGRFDPGKSPVLTATDPDGDFFVPNLDPGEYRYEVRDRVVGKGSMALFLTLRDDPMAEGEFEIVAGETTPVDVDLSLDDRPSGTITGEVFLNGQPAAGLTVGWEGPTRRTAEIDEQGWFDLGTLPAGDGELAVRNSSEGLFSAMSRLHREKLTLAAGQHAHLRFDLHCASVTGRVRTAGSFLPAAAGAFVTLRQEDEPEQFTIANPLTGGFDFRSVPLGTYQVIVRQQGAALWQKEVQVQDDLYVDVELEKGVRVEGVLSLPEGVSLADPSSPEPGDGGRGPGRGRRGGGGAVFLRLETEAGGPPVLPRFDREGLQFEVEGASPGSYRAVLQNGRTEYRSEPFEVGRSGATGLVLPLQANG